ncbi:MAG: hypothetical protein ACRD1Z_05550 [Vicinamibacteria bacterium]
MRGTLVLAATLFFGAAASAQVERLDSEHQPILRDFQAGKGRARLVAILSPT